MAEKVLFQIFLDEEENSIHVKSLTETQDEVYALSKALVELYKKLSTFDEFIKLVELESEDDIVDELLKQMLTQEKPTTINTKEIIKN